MTQLEETTKNKSEMAYQKEITNEGKKEVGLNYNNHQRLLHRLVTARVTVWGGSACIVFLTIAIMVVAKVRKPESDFSVVYEILRSTITTLATIITLALGYIAGSNIEDK